MDGHVPKLERKKKEIPYIRVKLRTSLAPVMGCNSPIPSKITIYEYRYMYEQVDKWSSMMENAIRNRG